MSIIRIILCLFLVFLNSSIALANNNKIKEVENFVINWTPTANSGNYRSYIENINPPDYIIAFINLLNHESKDVQRRAGFNLMEQFLDGRTDGLSMVKYVYLIEDNLDLILNVYTKEKHFLGRLLGSRKIPNSDYIPCLMNKINRDKVLNKLNVVLSELDRGDSSWGNISYATNNIKACNN